MEKLINGQTGTEMWVDKSRVEEYLKLGHRKPSKGKPAKPKKTETPDTEEPEGQADG